MHDPACGRVAGVVCVALLARFHEQPAFQEFWERYCRAAMAMLLVGEEGAREAKVGVGPGG